MCITIIIAYLIIYVVYFIRNTYLSIGYIYIYIYILPVINHCYIIQDITNLTMITNIYTSI